MSLIVSDLTKTYGAQNAVDHISFTAEKGQILGFLGPNGAGKSTTMKIATCYIPPTSGVVTVEGFDVNTHPLEVRKVTGYLPEHNPLYLDMYVHEYLHFIGGLHHLKGKSLSNRVNDLIEMVGLTIEQRKKIGQLSKGYRQRVGLAQALIHDPKVLILDEPTTGLDPNQIVEIRSVIKNIGKEKTVIFSTHIMQEVEALCDRVVIINRGKIAANAPVGELKRLTTERKVIAVEFEKEIDADILKSINGVTSVERKSGNLYLIEAPSNADVRSEIFKISTEKGWVIVGLKQEENSLEKIFQDLTAKKG